MGETSVMATTKICETNPTKEKNLLTAIFKHTMGIYTHTDDGVSRDKHGICGWVLYHCMSRCDTGETCVDWLSSLSASTRFCPIWRLPMRLVISD